MHLIKALLASYIEATWVVILALAACGPDPAADDTAGSSGDTSTSTGMNATPTTSGDDTTDASTGAACLEIDYPAKWGPDNDPGWELGCGFPELCPGEASLVFSIEGDFDAPLSVETEELERARCMVRALRDRQLGQFAFTLVDPSGPVVSRSSLEIVGDQVIARGEPGLCVLLVCNTHEALRLLRPPAFFTGCVDGDARALFRCLYDSLLPEPACLPGPLPCR